MVAETPLHHGGPSAGAGRTLLDLYREAVARSPDRLAIDCDDGQLTHIELFDAVRALAGRLGRRGIGPGDRVGIRIAAGTVDLYVAILGVLHAGAAYVLLDGGAAGISADLRLSAVVESELAIRELHAPAGVRRSVRGDDTAWVAVDDRLPPAGSVSAVTHRDAVAAIATRAPEPGADPPDRMFGGHADSDNGGHIDMWVAWQAGAVFVPAPPVQSITPE